MIPPPFSSPPQRPCNLSRETLLTWRRRRRRRMVGSVGSFHEWLSEYGKRKCRGFLRRARAAIKKRKRRIVGVVVGVGGGGGGERRVNKFRYDPWSYALNFDDGVGKVERADAVLVFVLWVKPPTK